MSVVCSVSVGYCDNNEYECFFGIVLGCFGEKGVIFYLLYLC